MKRIYVAALSVALVAAPAHALKITNLDTVAHTVELVGRGVPQRYTIPPGETEYVTGASQGFLSLVTAPVKKKTNSSVNADGLLSGIIGAARNQNIPADPMDNFTIWPEGKLMLQSRTKRTGRD